MAITFTDPLLDQWDQGGSETNTSFRNAGTGTNDVPATGGKTHDWTNPGNVTSQLSASTANLASSAGTYVLPYLRASNFGFNIPTTATLVGVEVEIVWGTSNSDYTEDEIRLAWGASAANLSATNNGDLAAIPTSDQTTEVKGSPTDLWGELTSTLTPAVLNSSDFGWVIKLGRANGPTTTRTARIDCMRAKVYYSVPEPLAGNVRVTQTEALVLVTEAKEARITQVYAEVLTDIVVPITFPAGRRQVVVVTPS